MQHLLVVLQQEKIILLQHFNFYSFTLWMPPCFGCPGPSPCFPPSPSARHWYGRLLSDSF